MNAGFIPLDHWVHENGGRIVGEACHIIDLMTFLVNDKIKNIYSENITPGTKKFSREDNKSITLKYLDGSMATISYFATGSKQFPKEYMEVHFDEKTIVLDNYQSLKGYGIKIDEIKTAASQKGHYNELVELHKVLTEKDSAWPIELWDIVQTSEVTIELIK